MFSVSWCLTFSFHGAKGSKQSLAQEGKTLLILPDPPVVPKPPTCRSAHSLADLAITQIHRGWMEITWGASKWEGRKPKRLDFISLPVHQVWTGGSRNKTIPGMFLQLLKINTQIILWPHPYPGRIKYQRFLPGNLSAQKWHLLPELKWFSASSWAMAHVSTRLRARTQTQVSWGPCHQLAPT